jgi:hypothetical protein
MDNQVHLGEWIAPGEELIDKLELTGDPMMKVFAEKFDFRMIDSTLDVLRGKQFAAHWRHWYVKEVFLIYSAN